MNIEFKTPPPVKPTTEVVITLTEREAKMLLNVFGHIAGCGDIRPLTNDLWSKLHTQFGYCCDGSNKYVGSDLHLVDRKFEES